ncbi:hypothetical protein [Amycolatopsis viridis]|uniref:Cobalamin biosynthesis protein CobT n=1 Tax=Amycolatopsis viridis TaxID=185678 RepID=A0ABX0SZ60_9PSEU|nr:hypothetical protein [Amycolatopsis viridis]NIH80586.1 cobalamin biosynthesis protein CobT [Amycolatopsis viridis]
MKAGARVAAGVGLGYLLGRSKKMRLALMIAAAGATGKTGVTPGKLLQQGLGKLGETPELSQLTGVARDQLINAAKAAAVTAASQRIESLTERLQEGGKSSSRSERTDEEEPDETGETEDRSADVDSEESEEPEEESAEEPEEDEEEPQRPPRARRTATRRRTGGDEDEGSQPAPTRARRSTRASTGRTPVRRARR